MEYQKTINLLDDTTKQPSKFRTRNWVEINDESQGMYNVSNQIKFKTSMIRSNLCDYGDAYINVKGTITVPGTSAEDASANNRNRKVIVKNYAPFTNCISEMNNTQVDDANDIDLVMPNYNLIEYSDIYSKTSRSLRQYYRDEPALDDNDAITHFLADNNNSISLKIKEKLTRQTGINGTKDIEIMVPLKYLSNFWRTLEMSLINCEISLMLTWSKEYILVACAATDQRPTFTITDRRLYFQL